MSESTREKYQRIYGKDYRTSNRPTKRYVHFLEEELTTLRADLDRVTRERDALVKVITDYNEARRKWMSKGDVEVQQEVDAWKTMEQAALAAVKPETRKNDPLGLNKDFTFTESGQVIDKPVEQKEV